MFLTRSFDLGILLVFRAHVIVLIFLLLLTLLLISIFYLSFRLSRLFSINMYFFNSVKACAHHLETSQLIFAVKSVDWF